IRDTFDILLNFHATDDFHTTITENVIIHGARALGAQEATNAVLAALGEEANEGFFGGWLSAAGGDVVAGFVDVEEEVQAIASGVEGRDHPAIDFGGERGQEEVLLIVVG